MQHAVQNSICGPEFDHAVRRQAEELDRRPRVPRHAHEHLLAHPAIGEVPCGRSRSRPRK
jgi:hypothetical protein